MNWETLYGSHRDCRGYGKLFSQGYVVTNGTSRGQPPAWCTASPRLPWLREALFARVCGQERYQSWAAAGVAYSARSACGLELRDGV